MRTVVCSFCGASVFFERNVVHARDYARAHERFCGGEGELWSVAGRRYRVHGRIASGHSCDVLLAESATGLPQRVVIKALRASEDEALFDAEQRALDALAASAAAGSDHFRGLIPEVVGVGTLTGGAFAVECEPRATVLRYPSGFIHTLEDVRQAHDGDLDPRHAVWIWRRLLEIVGWLQRSGWRHGAILPAHVLVHARDHGVRLVGFSLATRGTESPVDVVDPAYAVMQAREADDVAASARLISWLLGGDGSGRTPGRVPEVFAELIAREARGSGRDALELVEEIRRVAQTLYGPPRFVRLSMPGW